jgi:hypothetical protein
MSQPSEMQSVPHTFSGALAFNQRTIANAIATLLKETATGGPISNRPLTTTELVNVLLLLESIASSTGMYLDGTLPPRDVKQLKDLVWRVKAQSGVTLKIDFINPPAAELPSFFSDAAEAASLLIDRDLENLDTQRDPPLDGDISAFVRALAIVRDDPSGRLTLEFAEKTAADVASGRESFRGSKCVAGLLLARLSDAPVALRACECLEEADEHRRRRIAALLINRFRINYINTLAGARQAAYLADVGIEDLKAAQVVLFARYLAMKVAASDADTLSLATKPLFDRHFSTVPLGFAIFMNSLAASPLDLLNEAMKVRDLSFAAAAARATPQRRFVHQLTADEFASFQDYLFKSRWVALVNASERAAFSRSELREIAIPGAIGAATGAVLGALASGPVGAAAGSLAGSVIQHVAERLTTGRLGNRDVHVDQYRRLSSYLALAMKNDRLAIPFRERVEAVFGRPLVAH